MKRVIAFLLCLILCLSAMAACDKGSNPSDGGSGSPSGNTPGNSSGNSSGNNSGGNTDKNPDGTIHEHSFESSWLYDESQHWHAAACEHTDVESGRADHVDRDGNDICDVCGYIKDHTHSYEDTWSWGSSTHYHKSACGHNVKADEAKHADKNNDGVCDVCTYDYDHVHTYDELWVVKGEEGHWHLPTCDHTIEGADLTPHTDENNDGDCDVCGYNGGHVHTFDEAWTTTDDEHWREVSCGHSIPVADKGVHVDENGDTVCDECGYTPPHFHTFEDTLSSDANAHWYASTCGHDIRKDEASHEGYEEDGVCDVCAYVLFRLYTVTVHVPEYMTVYTPDGTAAASFILKENTPATFTVTVPATVEVSQVVGAKQSGKPMTDGDNRIYTFTISGITSDTEVTIEGNKITAVEVIVPEATGSFTITGVFKYSFEDITFTAPSAGRYMIFSTSHETVGFGIGEIGEDGYEKYPQVLYLDVAEAGEVSLKSRYFSWSVPDNGTMEYTYVVAKVDSEITLTSLRGEGYTLPTNADVTVYFTAPKAGRYQISSSTLGLAWNDYICDSIVVTATEDNQLMSFTVRNENTSKVSYTFDCTIVSMDASPLNQGENTVTAPYGSYLAAAVQADQAGFYMVQTPSPYINFFTWNENTGTMNSQGSTYVVELAKGERVVFYISVDVYDYDGTDDVTDTVCLSFLGHVPELTDGGYAAPVGVENSFVSEYPTSDFILSVADGDQISVDGGKTWHQTVQVTVADFGFVSYQVKSGSGSDTVSVRVDRIAYEFTLDVGTRTETLVPGKEYTVYLTGTQNPDHYVNYILSWNVADLSVVFGGTVIASGDTVNQYSQYYSLTMVYNGSSNVDVTFTLADPYVSDGGESGGDTAPETVVLTEGSNSIRVTVTDYFCAGTTVTFTAETTANYILSLATGETNADVVVSDDYTSESITLPYVFTLKAGETIEFTVFTTANMTLTEDYIDLVLTKK